MTLPASFARDGFLPPDKVRGKVRRLLVATDGWANTGKTEFALSAPGPIIWICVNRDFDGLLDNSNPPATRCNDYALKVIQIPLPGQLEGAAEYNKHWRAFYTEYMKALQNPDARTVILDGDSDTWELQRLAAFGKVTQVPSLMYPDVNAARKAMISRAWDSGKIVVSTNKLEHEYASKVNDKGKDVQVKTGNLRRQGFRDWEYLWGVHLRHMRDPDTNKFGVQLLMAKADTSLAGIELWDQDCNMPTLLQTIYPQVPLEEWGY